MVTLFDTHAHLEEIEDLSGAFDKDYSVQGIE
jgi:hypothetical protein